MQRRIDIIMVQQDFSVELNGLDCTWVDYPILSVDHSCNDLSIGVGGFLLCKIS